MVRARLTNRTAITILVLALTVGAGSAATATGDVSSAPTGPPLGAGEVVALGDAPHAGSAQGLAVTAIAPTATGAGYWLATSDGRVEAFGDATQHGSPAGLTIKLRQPIVDMAATPEGDGYWLAAADGAVFAFGAAPPVGPPELISVDHPVVAIAATPSGKGYWLATADGGVRAFGDASYHGSAVDLRTGPIAAIDSTPSGDGYWLVSRGGGVFAFGDAVFSGSAAGVADGVPIVDIAASPSGSGYWMANASGRVFSFGDAAPFDPPAVQFGAPVTALAVSAAHRDAKEAGEAAANSPRHAAGVWVATGGRRLGDFVSTCYALRGRTRSGRPVGRDVIAVDPRVIPLGTQVWIPGEGARVALDTGGNIRGRRIDVWRPSTSACRQYGRQTIGAYVLN